MSSEGIKGQKPFSYQALIDQYQTLLDQNQALQAENQDLKIRLNEAEELERAISERDLDALVIPGPEGELIFTLDSADYAYRVLVETMNEGTVTVACDGTILYCNSQFAKLMRMSPQAIVGTSIYRFIAPENLTIFSSLLKLETGAGEIKLQAKEGILVPVYMSISSLKVDRSPNAWCLVFTDLTEYKKNQEILSNIQTARRKEIHHRIKNNLQVISSLLDLQAEKFKDRQCINGLEILEAFKDSQNRVASIALVHEELNRDKDTNNLEFSIYLKKLVGNLFQTYSFGNTNVSLNMNLEENIVFDTEIAVPLGMIVNELVSNSLKYAFAEGKEGEIRVQLCKKGINRETSKSLFSLTISDNGKGIPENLDLENIESLGLQLVDTLVDQLDGEIELKREHGTEFRITFEVEEKPVIQDKKSRT